MLQPPIMHAQSKTCRMRMLPVYCAFSVCSEALMGKRGGLSLLLSLQEESVPQPKLPPDAL